MRWTELAKQPCPVARGLSVVGDRWTLMILRDCFLGIRRFEQFQTRLGVTRHILADRLRKLEEAGVLERRPYSEHPPRHEYRLTERGLALHPVIVSLIAWAEAHAPGEGPTAIRLVSRRTGAPVSPLLVDAATGEPITPRSIEAQRAEPD